MRALVSANVESSCQASQSARLAHVLNPPACPETGVSG